MKDHIVGRLTRLSDWYWGAPGSGLRRLEVTPRPSTSTSSSPLRWFDDQKHNNNKPSLMGMRRWLISLIPIQHPESSHSLLMQRVEVRMTILWKDFLAIGKLRNSKFGETAAKEESVTNCQTSGGSCQPRQWWGREDQQEGVHQPYVQVCNMWSWWRCGWLSEAGLKLRKVSVFFKGFELRGNKGARKTIWFHSWRRPQWRRWEEVFSSFRLSLSR